MRFVSDFINTIVGFAFLALMTASYVISEVFKIIKGLFSLLKLLASDMFADISLIILLVYQMILSVFSSMSLSISKFFFCLSKVSHKKSEEIVDRLWIN